MKVYSIKGLIGNKKVLTAMAVEVLKMSLGYGRPSHKPP
jgi:hypothetical protein